MRQSISWDVGTSIRNYVLKCSATPKPGAFVTGEAFAELTVVVSEDGGSVVVKDEVVVYLPNA